MRTGELAKRAGCTVETVRSYKRMGLLSAPIRCANNYRMYDSSHLEVLSFIHNCRALEMTPNEIGMLLRNKEISGQDCGEVDIILESHIDHVSKRIRNLQQLESQLISLRKICHQIQPVTKCAILRELADQLTNHPDTSDHVD